MEGEREVFGSGMEVVGQGRGWGRESDKGSGDLTVGVAVERRG